MSELAKIIRVARFGLLSLLLATFIFALWAYFAPIESAAIAAGKITVSGNRRAVQHLEGGIVKKILVKDGEQVVKGQVLVQLDNTPTQAGYEISRYRLFELMAQRARLNAQINGLASIDFPQELISASDQQEVKQILKNQRAIFVAESKSQSGREAILKQRIQQLAEERKGTETELASAVQQLKLINNELQAIKPLAEQHYISRSQVFAYEREKAKLEGNVGEKKASIASLGQRIGETKIQLITLQDDQHKKWVTEFREAGQQLAQQYQQEKASKDVLTRTTIRAPQAGTVVGLNIHTVGGVIHSGQTLMEILPAHERLIVEAQINPLDIDVVHKGLKAKVLLTAFQRRTTPMLLGVVKTVSADAFTDSRTGKNYYRAEIEINKQQLDHVKHVSLYPGMPAEVMIITNKLTPWEYFMAPIQRSFSHAFREQ